MDRVHICTLHAMNRMVEKILHLHFMFLWTIRDKHVQALHAEDYFFHMSSRMQCNYFQGP